MSGPCFEDTMGFNDRWLMAIGIPLASLMISLLLFPHAYEQGNWSFLWVCIPMSAVYTSIFWFSLRKIYTRVKERFPDLLDIHQRLLWVFAGFLGLYLIVHYSVDAFFAWLLPQHVEQGRPSQVVSFIATLIMSSLVITIYEALSFYIQLQRSVAEKAVLERQNVESQLEGLRNQVNPHFLFNSLNTLIYLIPEDTDKAVRFVRQLSKVYRYVLESRDAKTIPLAEELAFLKSYIFLLKERFGENLQIELRDLDKNERSAIVPLTLQMLFENAIKHNVISTGKPLHIEVFAENGHLVVRNNLQRKNQVMDSTGVGLQNIKDRYRILTDCDVDVIVSREYFTVILPAIETLQPA
ncbi:MAG: histidine kinase [Saprospiraceae bacterium]